MLINQPPTANRQPPTANRQPPTANRQPPTANSQLTKPINNRGHDQEHFGPGMLRVWLCDDSIFSLLPLFHDSVRSRLIVAEQRAMAEIQLVDWRSGVSFEAISPQVPALVIIDDQFEMPGDLQPFNEINFSLFEFVDFSELHTPIVDLRIRKLWQVSTHYFKTLVKVNAEFILDAVMQQSNDWMVVKGLDHRFIKVSGKFCRENEKAANEILGLNDLEIGTPAELVLGRAETNWRGFWALDKEVTDSGESMANPPFLVDEDENLFEAMNKVPVRNANGEVFALLVCVYRFIREPLCDESGKSNNEKITKSTHLWEVNRKLSEFPALHAATRDRRKAEESIILSERELIAKNRFIATASHDLRQPLHAIGFYIAALEPKVGDDEEDLIIKLKHCVDSLNKLLTSLLDVLKLDANVVTAEKRDFSIAELLNSLASEYESLAREKSIEIVSCSDGSRVHSDPILLRRVLSNLLINAFNNTMQGKISLSAQGLGMYIEVVVADTGIGIPVDKQELVFEEFVKIESQSQDTPEGMGLGLSIVKRLCNLLSISLRMESLPDQGTRVILAVPLATVGGAKSVKVTDSAIADITARERVRLENVADKPPSILIIDDNDEVCTAVGMLLKHEGYNAVTASGPDEALSQLIETSVFPDVMLVDFHLSHDMTGPEAIDVVSGQLGSAVPALIITGDTTDDGLKEIAASGFRHIHKPVVVDELLGILEDMLDDEARH